MVYRVHNHRGIFAFDIGFYAFLHSHILLGKNLGGHPILHFQNCKCLVCKFQSNNFPVEIFAQNIPVEEQQAFKHMIIEAKILNKKGNIFKNEVVKLKKSGYKTEPAFAKLLDIQGDPYEGLLQYQF